VKRVIEAFALVLLALIGIKVAAALADVAIGPIAVLLGLVLIFMWLFTGRYH
jgi:hypothetical protein